MLEDAESETLDFIGSATTAMPVTTLAGRMAKRLQFSLREFRAERTAEAAFAYLRRTIEESGVFVLLLGNLGSHHTNIPLGIFRGFAISDPIAPLVVINDQDAKAAWAFTAMHELAHLWLGDTGVSGLEASGSREQYCSDVAGEVLLPTSELALIPKAMALDTAVAVISDFAKVRNVSRAMVAYRLLRVGIINKRLWMELSEYFLEEWLEFKQRQADKQRAAESGPNYYVVRRHRVGAALLGLVRRSLHEGSITYTKASKVLGVKPRNVDPLLYAGVMRGIQ